MSRMLDARLLSPALVAEEDEEERLRVAVERKEIRDPLSQWPVEVLRAECQRLGLVDIHAMGTLDEGGCLDLFRVTSA